MQCRQLHSGIVSPVSGQRTARDPSLNTIRVKVDPAVAGKTGAPSRWLHPMACETPRVLPDQPSEEATGPDELGTAPDEAIASARVRAPTRGNRRLEALLE